MLRPLPRIRNGAFRLILLFAGSLLLSPWCAPALTYPPIDGKTFLFGNSGVNAVGQATFVSPANGGWGYRYFIPKNYNPSFKYPVIIFLHGSGEAGIDNLAPLKAGNQSANGVLALLSSANPDNQTNYPCFFVVPQHPNTANWTWPNGGVPVLTNILATLNQFYAIDQDRVYLTGLSLGGLGAFDLPCLMPTTFACTVPQSGQIANSTSYPANLPIWIFHAADDNTVPVGGSDGASSLLRYRGLKVIYTRYATGLHSIWPLAYQTPLLLPWMFAQERGLVTTQDLNIFPSTLIVTSRLDTKLNLTVASPPNTLRVGWASSAIDYFHTAKTDGVLSGNSFSSTSSTFSPATVGGRIGIMVNLGRRLYTVTSFINATTVTLDISDHPVSGSGLNFIFYPPGNIFGPATGTANLLSWSLNTIPLSKGFQVCQAITTLPSANATLGGETTVNDFYDFTYIAPTVDTIAPTIAITSPTSLPVEQTSGVLNLQGIASDNVGVTLVTWSTNYGYSGEANGTASWTINNLPLQSGENIITVQAEDAHHNLGSARIIVTYSGSPANLPPEVSAGRYQKITWPNASVNLTGLVTDDDLPAGAHVTSSWAMISGPAPVTFGQANSPVSTASFSQPGSYVLQLTATDGASSGHDQVAISVLPSGPVVAAIDCGNTQSYTGSDGTVYAADPQTVGSNLALGTLYSPATPDDALYKSYHTGNGASGGQFPAYLLPVPNGTYDVVMKFVEPSNQPALPGARLLNILTQGIVTVSNLDLFSRVGVYYAYDQVIPGVVVTNGTLSVQVTGTSGFAIVSALVVRTSAVRLQSAFSSQVHGNVGVFSLPLNLTGAPTIESRMGSPTGSYRLVLNFNQPLLALSATLQLSPGQGGTVLGTALTPTIQQSTVTIDLQGVGNAQRLNLHLGGIQPGNTSVDLPFAVLWTDVSGDGEVNSSDLLKIKNYFQASLDNFNFQYDVNCDGTINVQDAFLARSLAQTFLPSPVGK